MKTGEIYKWQTSKARGHDKRYKYHVFIGKDAQNGNVTLLINSANYFNEGFELRKSDYPFFSNEASYIGCTSSVNYSDKEIQAIPEESYKGTLNTEHFKQLREHISKSEVLELRFIDFICGKLDTAIS